MSKYQQIARNLFAVEAEAITGLSDRLSGSFDSAVAAILECKGRVVVGGMGKSGLIGKKIVATFNSTGTSSFFLHPAEAVHGDIGLMRADDLLLLISKSGQLVEMDILIAAARRLGMITIALCGTPGSELAQKADITLDCSVAKEACPNNLVPTSSSTAALVMGDALAVALLSARNFTPSDFAVLHPGGFLGRRLLKRVEELHHTGGDLPLVSVNTPMKEMLVAMTSKRLGCVVTADSEGKVAGIFTDGDLRRVAEHSDSFFQKTAGDVMIRNPRTVRADDVLDSALAVMEKYAVTQLPTVDGDGKLVGIIHLHDILKSKLV
jgi:arabinose-5-phosphate isomerase